MVSFRKTRRKLAYQKARYVRSNYEEELCYTECKNCELATVHTIGGDYSYIHLGHIPEEYATYKWSDDCEVSLLQKYKSKTEAMAGHIKWCMKEGIC